MKRGRKEGENIKKEEKSSKGKKRVKKCGKIRK